MCGIIAMLGNHPGVLKMLIQGLERLEYRGYDSAGVCVHSLSPAVLEAAAKAGGSGTGTSRLQSVKAAGKVAAPRQKAGATDKAEDGQAPPESSPFYGTVGIAHTRWATHGKPNETNSHPHVSSGITTSSTASQVAVVHNGIIENHAALKSDLRSRGHAFKSETDSEVLAVLVVKKPMSGP